MTTAAPPLPPPPPARAVRAKGVLDAHPSHEPLTSMTDPPCAQEMTVGTPRPAPPAHPPAENSGAGPGGGNGSDWAWGAYVRGDPGDAGGEGGGGTWAGGAAAAAVSASSAGRVETLPIFV